MMEYDVFISHASEDKASVALPLAARLEQAGLTVWLDAFELTLGDSVRGSIEHGMSRSRFGVVILSPNFFSKQWPGRELDALFAREDGGEKVILPIWHRVGQSDVLRFSPVLAARIGVSTERGIESVATEVLRAVRASRADVGLTERVDYRAQELAEIRRQMLEATSHWNTRMHLYAIEEFLQRYPHDPEGRLLRDQLVRAVEFAEPRASRIPAPRPAAMRPRFFGPVAVGVLLAILLALLFLVWWR